MSKSLEGLKAYLESDEGKAAIKDRFQGYIDKKNDDKEFFGTERFLEIIEIIKRDLDSHKGFLNEESYRYNPEHFETDIEDLMQVFNSIAAADLEEHVEENLGFENFCYDYDEMRFKWVFGQGCAMIIEKLP